jgi:hypothetical protein
VRKEFSLETFCEYFGISLGCSYSILLRSRSLGSKNSRLSLAPVSPASVGVGVYVCECVLHVLVCLYFPFALKIDRFPI